MHDRKSDRVRVFGVGITIGAAVVMLVLLDPAAKWTVTLVLVGGGILFVGRFAMGAFVWRIRGFA